MIVYKSEYCRRDNRLVWEERELSECLENLFDSDRGELESLKRQASLSAHVISRLIEVLVEKDILTFAQALEFVGHYDQDIMLHPPSTDE